MKIPSHLYLTILLILPCVYSQTAAQGKKLSRADAEVMLSSTFPTVTVHTSNKIHQVHPDFWGTNFLYWVDDDAALANGKIAAQLKEVNMKLLRYPGGTVADNFHWKTNTLENTNMFPYESGEAESDFDEFMKVSRQVGAEVACVLNTESWAVKKDLAGGAHEAAEWLRYCKKKGYKVKYWEIGNETYWHPVMSASEYADLVNIYADTLKRIDPNIILGINGHWNTSFTGTKERIKPGTYAQLMDYRNNIRSRADYNKYTKYLEENTLKPVTQGDAKWWQTLAEKCGRNVDMIIIHWYFGDNQLPMVSQKLLEVRSLFKKMYPDKNYLFNMSEYNITERSPKAHMHLTEMVGAMLTGKIDLSNLWPMRLKYKKPTLLEWGTDKPSILFQIHKQLSANLTGNLVQTASSSRVPAFATYSGSSATVVLTASKLNTASPVNIKVDGNRKFSTCTIWRISGSEFDYKVKEEKLPVKNGAVTVSLQPLEVLTAIFK